MTRGGVYVTLIIRSTNNSWYGLYDMCRWLIRQADELGEYTMKFRCLVDVVESQPEIHIERQGQDYKLFVDKHIIEILYDENIETMIWRCVNKLSQKLEEVHVAQKGKKNHSYFKRKRK